MLCACQIPSDELNLSDENENSLAEFSFFVLFSCISLARGGKSFSKKGVNHNWIWHFGAKINSPFSFKIFATREEFSTHKYVLKTTVHTGMYNWHMRVQLVQVHCRGITALEREHVKSGKILFPPSTGEHTK